MEAITTFAGTLWRLISWMPGFFLRRFFSKDWLAEHMQVDVRARHDPVSIRGGELPDFEVWLLVTNRGHFSIELDRLSMELCYASATMRSNYLHRTKIVAGKTVELYIRNAISTEQVAHISKNRDRPTVTLQVRAEFNCKVHNFSTDTGQLTGIKPELMNF